jgi:hypothetical protein
MHQRSGLVHFVCIFFFLFFSFLACLIPVPYVVVCLVFFMYVLVLMLFPPPPPFFFCFFFFFFFSILYLRKHVHIPHKYVIHKNKKQKKSSWIALLLLLPACYFSTLSSRVFWALACDAEFAKFVPDHLRSYLNAIEYFAVVYLKCVTNKLRQHSRSSVTTRDAEDNTYIQTRDNGR